MKELSIEEKVQAYDGNYKAYTELINRLEDVKNAIKKQNYGIAMDILCKPCPEFQITAHSDIKESEDEKIRKSLAAYFAKFKPDDMWDADFSFGDIVSWFEKQSGQKPCMIQWKGDNLKEVINLTGKDKSLDKWFTSFEAYEKYVHNHNNIFKLFNEDGSHYEVPVGAWIVKTPDGCNVASKAFLKQKPAWGKEGEKEVAVLEAYIRSKDWSERHIDRALGIVDELVNKVKSLRPQSTWKPSEEQMQALCKYIDTGNTNATVLESLYNDLNKLREE